MNKELIDSVVLRCTGRNSFVVSMNNIPGVINIICRYIDTTDRNRFNRLISSNRSSSLLKIQVKVCLGMYCLTSRSFINCTIQYICSDDEEKSELDNKVLSRIKFKPVNKKRILILLKPRDPITGILIRKKE